VANGPELHAAGWDAADQMRSGGRLPNGHRPHVRSNRQDHARISKGPRLRYPRVNRYRSLAAGPDARSAMARKL